MKESLDNLIQEYWKDFVGKEKADYVIKPAFPIVWFGNIEKYFSSSIKIVTAGLNPGKEFQEGSCFHSLDYNEIYENYQTKDLDEKGIELLKSNLNDYFNECQERYPNNHYFKPFDNILREFGSSYFEGLDNVAIHISTQSAIATDPFWNGLVKTLSKEELKTFVNIELSQKLIDLLKPNLIITSVEKKKVERFMPDFKHIKTFAVSDDLRNGYFMLYRDANNRHLINGLYSNTPFGFGKKEWVKETIPEIVRMTKRETD
ncbi:MAG: hypothetical protein FWF76_03320 [Oscillospiraceae bacterium]|nr:hypothetical protein [Oscillospiraceae bacterium]